MSVDWLTVTDQEAQCRFDDLDSEKSWPCCPKCFLVENYALEEDSVSPNSMKPFGSPTEVPSVFWASGSEVIVAFCVGHEPPSVGRPAPDHEVFDAADELVDYDPDDDDYDIEKDPFADTVYAALKWQQGAYRALERASWAKDAALVPAVWIDNINQAAWVKQARLLRGAIHDGYAYGLCDMKRIIGSFGVEDVKAWNELGYDLQEISVVFFHEATEASEIAWLVSLMLETDFPSSMGDGA